jgi:hypothetical protein
MDWGSLHLRLRRVLLLSLREAMNRPLLDTDDGRAFDDPVAQTALGESVKPIPKVGVCQIVRLIRIVGLCLTSSFVVRDSRRLRPTLEIGP